MKNLIKAAIVLFLFNFAFNEEIELSIIDYSNGQVEIYMQNEGPVGGIQFIIN